MTTSYNRLSQAIKGVHRLGGKVEKVTMFPAAVKQSVNQAAKPVSAPSTPTAQAPEPPKTQEVRSSKSKRKQKG
jgi:hypothetical protein